MSVESTESHAEVLNVHAAKTRLSELLARVERGEQFVIARAGKPVARLVAAAEPGLRGRREFGFMELGIPDDAFLQPMSQKELAGWERPI